MRKMKKKHHILYETTNVINGKIYVGIHSTNNIDDGYIGCGVYSEKVAKKEAKRNSNIPFINAVNKYGYESFKRKVIADFENRHDLVNAEEFIVNEDFIDRCDTYNIALGGRCTLGMLPKTKKQREAVSLASSRDYVVVNLESGEVYEVSNLTKWSLENFPDELIVYGKTGPKPRLRTVLWGNAETLNGKWWCCKKNDWTGKPLYKKRDVRWSSKSVDYKIKSPFGIIYEGNNVTEFSRKMGLDPSAVTKLMLGKIKSHKGFTIA
jgi:hypothetical protein